MYTIWSVPVLHQGSLFVEFKDNLLASQLLVHTGIRADLVLNIGLLVAVQVHFDDAASIELHADTLSNDFSGVNQVLKHGVVHGGERAAAGALLLVLGPRLARRLGLDLALSDENNMFATEFLLQFAHQAHLDLLESSEEGRRNGHNNRGLSGHLHLLSS